MPRPKPSQELIDAMAAKYMAGYSVSEVARHFEVSNEKARMYIKSHPDVIMRGFDGKPRRQR